MIKRVSQFFNFIKNNKKAVLSLLALCLFVCNKHVCDIVFPAIPIPVENYAQIVGKSTSWVGELVEDGEIGIKVVNGVTHVMYRDIIKWWILRLSLYAVLIAMLFSISNMVGKTKFISFVLSLGIGYSISDVIDRICFDINKFTIQDIVMIIITIALSYYAIYVRRSR